MSETSVLLVPGKGLVHKESGVSPDSGTVTNAQAAAELIKGGPNNFSSVTFSGAYPEGFWGEHEKDVQETIKTEAFFMGKTYESTLRTPKKDGDVLPEVHLDHEPQTTFANIRSFIDRVIDKGSKSIDKVTVLSSQKHARRAALVAKLALKYSYPKIEITTIDSAGVLSQAGYDKKDIYREKRSERFKEKILQGLVRLAFFGINEVDPLKRLDKAEGRYYKVLSGGLRKNIKGSSQLGLSGYGSSA